MSRSVAPLAVAARTEDILGEVPIWCPIERALYWADLFRPALHRLDPATGLVRSWALPEKIGSFALCRSGDVLMAARSGLARFVLDGGTWAVLARPEQDQPDNLLNDGRCDRRGRFWVASMNKRLAAPSGRLHRFTADGTCRIMAEGIWLPNGLAWSPDDRVMYFADSHTRAMVAYDFDLEAGMIGRRHPLADGSEAPGTPDGSTVDADGFIWNARFGGGCVARYAPDGRLDRVVPVPVSQPTACTFGGDRLGVLYVTTASFRLDDTARAAQPLAGAVLALDVGVRGLPEPRWAG